MGLGLPNDGATQRHGTTMEDVAGVSKRLELEVQFSLPMVREAEESKGTNERAIQLTKTYTIFVWHQTLFVVFYMCSDSSTIIIAFLVTTFKVVNMESYV